MLAQYVFWFLTFVAVFSAIGMILSKNPVYSVLSLIVTFFAIAGHYFLLNAQFLGAVHVIVYAGAIMVLFLYVIMMLNLNNLQETRKGFLSKALTIVSGGILMLVLIAALNKAEFQAQATGIDTSKIGMVENIGTVLFREYLIPFELASILFLGAMVGAVYLSKKSRA
ncbi:MAG: NADH-quinone oxidoreductase subunit J [Flavobacteriales bacterium]|nr:NADH-quinone oxidoreductase subunit J [Flavobacteriales bacterium]